MSDDLAKRLRDAAYRAKREYPEVFRVSEEIAYEAADRIEKLEAALRIYACKSSCRNCYGEIRHTQFCGMTATKALEGKDE